MLMLVAPGFSLGSSSLTPSSTLGSSTHYSTIVFIKNIFRIILKKMILYSDTFMVIFRFHGDHSKLEYKMFLCLIICMHRACTD